MNLATLPIVDSHAHFWDRSRFEYAWLEDEDEALQRDYFPADLQGYEGSGPGERLAGVVAVQANCRAAESLAEAAWFQDLAAGGAPIAGVVAFAALERGAGSAADLEALTAVPLVSGVRRLLQDEPQGFALQDSFLEGVRLLSHHGLAMDVCVRQAQIGDAIALAESCPDVTFVLDHLGKPVISDDAFGPWSAQLSRLASLPNVLCKISGLASEAPAHLRTATALRRWLDVALDEFGPGRCMFGSDWPVVASVSTYREWFDVVSLALEGMTISEKMDVMGATALATYGPAGRVSRGKES